MRGFRTKILLTALLALAAWLPLSAQLPRGGRTVVRGGMFEKPDTLRAKRDSLRMAALFLQIDSLQGAIFSADSTTLTALRTDDIRLTDSLLRAQIAMAGTPTDTTTKRVYKKGWFMSDSMSLSKVCWISTVLPGYGQIYNKQYWKLPILYGALGTGLALFISENKTFKPLKSQYEAMTNQSMIRTPELDALQTRMIRSNTKRQLYLGITIASYIYFLGDAALSYKTNDVSHVKKATTLACIFPGAGQIYNKSYWKVPFVIGGFAAMIYCVDWNNRGFQRFKKAYSLKAEAEANGTTSTDEFGGRYSASFLRDLRNNYRRNRDFCLILSGALYILQIVDAHVDAHLKDYDVSDDLTMNIEPMVDYAFSPTQGRHQPVFGFNLSLKF